MHKLLRVTRFDHVKQENGRACSVKNDENHECMDEAWDDVTGAPLPPDLAKKARAEEMD